MDEPQVKIGRLHVRVPGEPDGDSQHVGQELARGITRALESQVSPGAERHLSALSLRVTVPFGSAPETVRARVIAAIASALE